MNKTIAWMALVLASLLVMAGTPAGAQDAEKKETVKKEPRSACEKCVREALRQLQQCEAAVKKNDLREACLSSYDNNAKSCDDSACKLPAK